jgi:alpha-L-fucosidase 2
MKSGSASNPMKLWYQQPAERWVEALPVGNGRLGGMVFGGTETERIQLNEDTLWSGFPRDTNQYDAFRHLEEVREWVRTGQYAKAEQVVNGGMLGPWSESYQPLGNLYIKHVGLDHQVEHYGRELDLETAIAKTSYKRGQVLFSREVYVSAPDQVMAVHLFSNQPGQVHITASLDSLQRYTLASSGSDLILSGRCPSHVEPNYVTHPNPVIFEEKRGMQFEIRLKAVTIGGTVDVTPEGELQVKGADSVTLLLSAATSFTAYDKDPALGRNFTETCKARLEHAASFPYEELRNKHIEEHQRLFHRVGLYLGASESVNLPTDQRLERMRDGAEDNQLAALFFQYGRYLLISSSRPGTQPANLQGIWNHEVRPPWSSNYTTNINAQMNYWLAEPGNLSECHEPLLDMIDELRVTGQRTARIHYHCRGWTAHHNVDLWRSSTPVNGDAVWAFWPMGGAWLCSHLWERYVFTQDLEFLAERAYPMMKEAALFCLDWLVEDGGGYLVTNPSTSPENRFIAEDGSQSSISMASTMDMTLIRELFSRCVEGAATLGIDEALRTEWSVALEKLYPFQIGRYGQLQEWFKDFDEQEPGHRHVSHLYGLHPGNQITWSDERELIHACRKSLERRLAYGGGHTGWSCAWIINLWARLRDAEQAHAFVITLLTRSTYPNLFDAHPPFQIDGNFGGAAGIAEMLLQSHEGYIHLLPALPVAWSEGEVKGLKARGGFEVGMEWKNGTLASAAITPSQSGTCRILAGINIKVTCGEREIHAEAVGNGFFTFEGEAGKVYKIQGRDES